MENLGEYLKQEGMKASLDNANSMDNLWSEKAFGYLKDFLLVTNDVFMAENIREYAHQNGLEYPPSKRAWGAIIVRAKKEGLITFRGYSQVSNPKAHRANAMLWVKV